MQISHTSLGYVSIPNNFGNNLYPCHIAYLAIVALKYVSIIIGILPQILPFTMIAILNLHFHPPVQCRILSKNHLANLSMPQTNLIYIQLLFAQRLVLEKTKCSMNTFYFPFFMVTICDLVIDIGHIAYAFIPTFTAIVAVNLACTIESFQACRADIFVPTICINWCSYCSACRQA